MLTRWSGRSIALTGMLILTSCSSGDDLLQILGFTAGASHTCARLQGNTVKCWGDNSVGQLGYEDALDRGDEIAEMGDDLPFVDLGAGRTATQIAAGNNHTCALLDDATVKCWGANGSGQLGQDSVATLGDDDDEMGDLLPAISVGLPAVAIAAGNAHTCALLNDATVKCWGLNASGQLGQDNTTNVGDGVGPTVAATASIVFGLNVTAITAGNNHTCALFVNGSVRCWGANGSGQLGQGSTDDQGDGPGEIGLLGAIDLDGLAAIAIAAGGDHTCAILDSDDLVCWGEGGSGQLGTDDDLDIGEAPGDMGNNLLPIDLGFSREAAAIALGGAHTCAVLDNDALKCWGFNASGQLGLGDIFSRGDGDNIPVGDLMANLAAVPIFSVVQSVATGTNHTCALLSENLGLCWGNNNSGQLGRGDVVPQGDNAGEISALTPIDVGS